MLRTDSLILLDWNVDLVPTLGVSANCRECPRYILGFLCWLSTRHGPDAAHDLILGTVSLRTICKYVMSGGLQPRVGTNIANYIQIL